tara:strand:+ start:189 stop:437 length:249 start_codon:yes stop_codon:yes gene_type:complete
VVDTWCLGRNLDKTVRKNLTINFKRYLMKPKKRGQMIRLKAIKNGKVLKAKVVMHDSMNGYLAELPDGEWKWFRPTDWEEIT